MRNKYFCFRLLMTSMMRIYILSSSLNYKKRQRNFKTYCIINTYKYKHRISDRSIYAYSHIHKVIFIFISSAQLSLERDHRTYWIGLFRFLFIIADIKITASSASPILLVVILCYL